MTFSDWYAANVKPQLEDSLKILPVTAREPLRIASRQAMAACWNAAREDCIVAGQDTSKAVADYLNTTMPPWLRVFIDEKLGIMRMRA